MQLRGKMVDLLVALDPSLYRKHVTIGEKGKPILYVKFFEALYGLLKSALLFYQKLRRD